MSKKGPFLSIFALFLLGCGSSHSSSNFKQIFPMKVGNMFISQKDYFDLKTGKHYLTKIDTLIIIGTQVVNNDTFYLTNTRQYVINKSDGYWVKNGLVTTDGAELEAKYPGTIGDTYSPYIKPTSEKTSQGNYGPDTIVGNWEIISKDQQITVPAGTFTCLEYRSDHKSKLTGMVHFRYLAWWSPGYGIIRNENYYHSEDGTLFLIYREELLKEELK